MSLLPDKNALLVTLSDGSLQILSRDLQSTFYKYRSQNINRESLVTDTRVHGSKSHFSVCMVVENTDGSKGLSLTEFSKASFAVDRDLILSIANDTSILVSAFNGTQIAYFGKLFQ